MVEHYALDVVVVVRPHDPDPISRKFRMKYYYQSIPFGSFSWNNYGGSTAWTPKPQPTSKSNPLTKVRLARAKFDKGQTHVYFVKDDWPLMVGDLLITSISLTYDLLKGNEKLEAIRTAFVTEVFDGYMDSSGHVIGHDNVRVPVDYISSNDLIEKSSKKLQIKVDTIH